MTTITLHPVGFNELQEIDHDVFLAACWRKGCKAFLSKPIDHPYHPLDPDHQIRVASYGCGLRAAITSRGPLFERGSENEFDDLLHEYDISRVEVDDEIASSGDGAPSSGTEGWTILHLAVQNNFIEKLPSHLICAKNLAVRDLAGRTPLHIAALNRRIDSFAHVLTADLLRIKDNFDNSVILLAAKHDCLGQIPFDLLTPELLTLKNAQGETPLAFAVNHHAETIRENWDLFADEARAWLLAVLLSA